MATQQRFEGSSIEEVLGRVRAELGADAEIIEANKVRAGGIGGFFAKETFEVLAAPAARGAAGVTSTSDPVTAPSSSSLLDLADRISRAETAVQADAADDGPTEDLSPRRPAEAARTPLEAVLAGLGVASEDPGKPRSRAEQVAQQAMIERLRRADGPSEQPDAFEPMRPGEMPRISTEQSAFNDVLQRIATDAGSEISDAIAASLTPVGPVMTSRAASTSQATPMSSATPMTAPMATMADMPAAAAFPVIAPAHAGPSQAAVAEETSAEAAADAPHDAMTVAEASEPFEATRADLETDIQTDIQTDEVIHADAMPAVRRTDEDRAVSRTERLLSWLEHDHLPRTTLLSALRHLPRMDSLPASKGVVVAVVGDRARALRLCRQLARACDADPAAVVLASASYRGSAIPEDRRIIDLDEAVNDRRGWRRRTRPTFVAVESPAGLSLQAQTWTREIVAALDVHQVIGVVPAARKSEDVRAWTEAVGGVDGLALDRLEETTTPYAVLSLEIPVAYLDDEPATPDSWAEVLMERTAA